MIAMKTAPIAALALTAALITGCTMNGPGALRVHEALLYGGAQERVAWVYGTLDNSGKSSVKLGGQALEVRAQVADPLAVPGSLSLNGKATYRAPLPTTTVKLGVGRGPGDQTFNVVANADLDGVYYTDGRSWFKLAGQMRAGEALTGIAGPSQNLRGAGRLTDAEADALGGQLLNQGRLTVAVLRQSPDGPLSVEPAASETLQTALYILPGVQAAPGAVAPPASSQPGTSTNTQPAPVPSTPGTTPSTGTSSIGTQSGVVAVRELGRGSNSQYNASTPSAVVARSASAFASAWRTVSGNQSPAPAAPAVDFTRAAAITIYAGQKPSGGYGIRVLGSSLQAGTLTLQVEFTAPAPGLITTQSLTSPYLALEVQGSFTRVVVQDAAGNSVTVR